MSFDKNELELLASLLRMEIRKKERGVATFQPRPEQSPAEADEVKKHFEEALQFRRGVLDKVKTLEKTAVYTEDRPSTKRRKPQT